MSNQDDRDGHDRPRRFGGNGGDDSDDSDESSEYIGQVDSVRNLKVGDEDDQKKPVAKAESSEYDRKPSAEPASASTAEESWYDKRLREKIETEQNRKPAATTSPSSASSRKIEGEKKPPASSSIAASAASSGAAPPSYDERLRRKIEEGKKPAAASASSSSVASSSTLSSANRARNTANHGVGRTTFDERLRSKMSEADGAEEKSSEEPSREDAGPSIESIDADDAPRPHQFLEDDLNMDSARNHAASNIQGASSGRGDSGDGKLRSSAPASRPGAISVGGLGASSPPRTARNPSDMSNSEHNEKMRPAAAASVPGAVAVGGLAAAAGAGGAGAAAGSGSGTEGGDGGEDDTRGMLTSSLERAEELEPPAAPGAILRNLSSSGYDEAALKSKVADSMTVRRYNPNQNQAIPTPRDDDDEEDEEGGRKLTPNQAAFLNMNTSGPGGDDDSRVDDYEARRTRDSVDMDATVNTKDSIGDSKSLYSTNDSSTAAARASEPYRQGQTTVTEGQQARPPPPIGGEADGATIPTADGTSSVQFYSVQAVAVPLTNSSASGDEEDEEGQQTPPVEGSQRYVYSATLVTPWYKEPKRMACYGVIALMIGAAIALGVLFAPKSPEPALAPTTGVETGPAGVGEGTPAPTPDPTQSPTLSPTKPPPPAVTGIMSVNYLRSLYSVDCGTSGDKEAKCWPYVSVHGDTATMAPMTINPFTGQPLTKATWGNQILVFNKTYTTKSGGGGDGGTTGSNDTNIFDEDNVESNFELVQTIDVDYQPAMMRLEGDTLVVGSNYEKLGIGAVYVYGRNDTGHWAERQRIEPRDSRRDAKFGGDSAIEDDVMVIGAHQDRELLIGSVYIYRRNKDTDLWEQEQKLAPPNDGKMKNFGQAVALRGNKIAIGDRAYFNETDTSNDKRKGAVWIYEYDRSSKEWSMVGDVMRSRYCENWFGYSLAFTFDQRLLVGCGKDDDAKGSVYYYEPSETGEYVFKQKIVGSVREKNAHFGSGSQISVYSNVMAIGTDNTKAERSAVFVFLRVNDVWVEVQKIEPPRDDVEKFGDDVVLSENSLVVSSHFNAYFYELVEGPPNTPCLSSISDGAMFGDCGLVVCNEFHVAMDGGTKVVATNRDSLRIDKALFGMEKTNAGHFGGVAISGDAAVAGFPRTNSNNGSAIVYQQMSGFWFELTMLKPPHEKGRIDKENFGNAVAMFGDVTVVGAYHYLHEPPHHRGSIYVFRRHTAGAWPEYHQEANLVPDDSNLQGFGRAVSVVNNTIAVGDRIYKGSTGAAFVYNYDPSSGSWSSWFRPPQVITNDHCGGMFGSSVVLTKNDGLLIGCSEEEIAGTDAAGTGAVYYYSRGAMGEPYVLQQKIKSLNGMVDDRFGDADQIAVNEDSSIMAVGTDHSDGGSVHIFAKINGVWVQVETMETPPDHTRFGYKVALSGRTVLVSSIENVYTYSLEDCQEWK